MGDDKPQDNGPASEAGSDGGRRSRTPPTIDLEASRVETTEAAAQASAAADAATAHAEDLAGASQAADPKTGDPKTGDPKSANPKTRTAPGIVGGAVAGAVAAVLVGCAAWSAGLIGSSNTPNMSTVATIETLAARVARLEAVPASPPVALKPDPALVSRLEGMEKSLVSLRDGLAALRADVDRSAKALDGIKAAPSEAAAAAPDRSALDSRLAQLDAKIQSLSAESAQVKAAQAKSAASVAEIQAASARVAEAKPADDVKVRRAVAASALDVAVRQGEPFAPALDAARQFADDAAVLKPLDAFAATGVPSAQALGLELLALRRQIESAPDSKAVAAGAGWWDRLRASAEHLVKIRRTDAAATGDGSDILARLSTAAAHADLASARRDAAALPAADRARLQPWIDKVDAREAALAASRRFAANAVTALTAAP